LIFEKGILAKSFPIINTDLFHENLQQFKLKNKKTDDLSDVSLMFNKGAKKTSKSPFKNSGVMIQNTVYTVESKSKYTGSYTILKDILKTKVLM